MSDLESEPVDFSHPKTLAILGSIVLAIGVFLPLVSIPVVGEINYFRNGSGDGIIVLGFAAATVAIALKGGYKWLWATGVGSLALLAFTFFNFRSRMGDARQEMKKELADNPFAGIGEAMMESIQLEYGFAVMLIGAALVISAAMVARSRRAVADEAVPQDEG